MNERFWVLYRVNGNLSMRTGYIQTIDGARNTAKELLKYESVSNVAIERIVTIEEMTE